VTKSNYFQVSVLGADTFYRLHYKLTSGVRMAMDDVICHSQGQQWTPRPHCQYDIQTTAY